MLKVGDRAPDFSAVATTGETIDTRALRGKKLVVYFFPKAFTPGCTRESTRFRDAYDDIAKLDGQVIGVSVDDHKTQCDFAKSLRVTFPMIGDKDKRISKSFGVLWPLIGFDRRVTFIIDRDGVVAGVLTHEFQIVKHLDETLVLLDRLP